MFKKVVSKHKRIYRIFNGKSKECTSCNGTTSKEKLNLLKINKKRKLYIILQKHKYIPASLCIHHSLATDSPVLSFSRGRLLRVNYNPRLVGLAREVSQLSILGHNIHPKIVKMAQLAHKFMKQAKALEEVSFRVPCDDFLLHSWLHF